MNYPLCNPVLTQSFGANPEDYSQFGYPGHNGADFWTADRPPYVLAIETGTVLKVGWEERGYGKYVVLKHTILTMTRELIIWNSYYAHLESVSCLPGQKILFGRPLGLMGSTGNSTGPHLHLGIRFSVSYNPPYKGFVNPLPVLQGVPPALAGNLAVDPQAAPPPPLPGGTGIHKLYNLPGSKIIVSTKKKTVYRMKRYF